MPVPRASKVKLVWGLELALGLELYACAVLALHARGLRATPLIASPGLVIPALVIPPVFYVLVSLVIVRPLSPWRLASAVGAMCAIHTALVVSTGALFVIPDLVDYGAAVAFSLWGSPAVTMLQLTAAPLVLARLRPLLLTSRAAPRSAARAAPPPRYADSPAGAAPPAAREAVAPSPVPAAPSPAAAAPSREKGATSTVAPAAPVVPAAAAPVAAVLPVDAAPPSATASPVAAASPAATAPRSATVAVPAPPLPASRTPVATPAAPPAEPAPLVISSEATPFPLSDSSGPAARSAALPPPAEPAPLRLAPTSAAPDSSEPMVQVPFARIADQLPVEMFVRGREGLGAVLRPGVSLLVPRRLLLPHLAEGVAPVKWRVVADQFPKDELRLTPEEIESRLPDGALRLPLDEVVPQIPAELLTLSTPTVDVLDIEEFPPPFQPHVPPPSEALAEVIAAAERALDAPAAPAAEEEAETPILETRDSEIPDLAAPELSVVGREAIELEEAERPPARESSTPGPAVGGEARRIATLLAPQMNGLAIGERAAAGTALVTAVAPALSEDAVVATAVRVVPLLGDPRLFEPVSQATLSATEATIVLTPLASAGGGAMLVTAVASRGSLAWLERLSLSVAGERAGSAPNGGRARNGARAADELRATAVPPSVRELAGSLTAFGPVTPAVLRNATDSVRVCLFVPGSLDAPALAQLARDLYGALDGAEIGRVASVILRLGTYRLVTRAVEASSGHTTILVGGGRVARPGLARIELDRAAARLGALGQG
jgi:hypothetical protein